MKVWDRHAGQEVELPATVEPGRFQLLAPCVLNGHASLDKGDILWGDGNVRCVLSTDGADRNFALPVAGSAGDSPNPLIDEAVGAVTDGILDGELPSPIMPAQLEKHVDLLDIERLLSELLDAGHLQAISQRPRLDMRYDAEVLPVSRARRLAQDALTTLASNSRDWSRRRITGIVPARLKALVSEDEHAIYENVVFARLIDRVLAHLRARIHEVLQLLEKHELAKQLSDAQHLDHRLRQEICALWGQSFADNPEAGARAKETHEVLTSLYGKVRQLEHRGLYPHVPRNMNVPIALRNTNILQHDPHYRHLRPLWLLVNSGAAREVQTPQQKFETAKARGARYAAFIELLVRKALDASALLAWDDVGRSAAFGPWELRLRLEQGACSLELLDDQGARADRLTMVAGWRGRLPWQQQREDYYVFFCHDSESMDDELGENSVLHPLQFYAVERVRLAIEKWLLKQVLRCYPFAVAPIPGDLQGAIIAAAEAKVQKAGHGVKLVGLLTPRIEADVEGIVQRSSANGPTKSGLLSSLKLVRIIGLCRVCGHRLHPSSFHGSDSGFKAHCGQCGATWTLAVVDGRARVEYRIGKVERPFSEVGCREMTLAWLVRGARIDAPSG
ncbi:hypothetical protein HHL11_30075 [Ramlibacter sp. G-1-2-2]|uniref:DUF2357 domain-containing protein n=1 Tax=Ramlibacter agri TaxID=2728837 RepID=A0A848HC34_9BURK|nr:hypothetical protein [Ramlibacter agri]NML48034.1 hypothetical protein [Ramlibacter agri]